MKVDIEIYCAFVYLTNSQSMDRPKYTIEYCNSLPKFDRSVSLLCWAFNEEELIYGFLIKANNLLQKTVQDYEIVVVNDCSTDRTNEIIRSLQTKIPQIKLSRNSVNLGVGFSCRKAVQNATKEYLFWQTIDWSYDISYLRICFEFLKSYDIVQGVRRKPIIGVSKQLKPIVFLLRLFGIKYLTKRSDTISKAIISVINYILIRILFGVPLSDYQNITFYPTEFIKSIENEATSSFVSPEALIKAYWQKKSIVEVPISFIPRRLGKAKGTSLKTIKASVIDIFGLWFKWRILKRRNFQGYGKITRLKPEEWKVKA